MLIIDRFEGQTAICEADGGDIVRIDRSMLPGEAKEGDAIYSVSPGKYAIDSAYTKQRRDAMRRLMEKLFGPRP